jgi:hypothetical protein
LSATGGFIALVSSAAARREVSSRLLVTQLRDVRFQVLTVAHRKMTVFSVVAQFVPVEVVDVSEVFTAFIIREAQKTAIFIQDVSSSPPYDVIEDCGSFWHTQCVSCQRQFYSNHKALNIQSVVPAAILTFTYSKRGRDHRSQTKVPSTLQL